MFNGTADDGQTTPTGEISHAFPTDDVIEKVDMSTVEGMDDRFTSDYKDEDLRGLEIILLPNIIVCAKFATVLKGLYNLYITAEYYNV